MTTAEEPPRKQSTLNDDEEFWAAPARPDPATVSSRPQRPPAPASAPPPASMRRKAGRDLAEAKGRKRARDAAYAWAAAEQRAVIRLHELIGEFQGALHRGTAPEVIAQFVAEACQRYDIDPGGVPEQIRATVGLPGAPAEPQPVPQPGPELDDSAGI